MLCLRIFQNLFRNGFSSFFKDDITCDMYGNGFKCELKLKSCADCCCHLVFPVYLGGIQYYVFIYMLINRPMSCMNCSNHTIKCHCWDYFNPCFVNNFRSENMMSMMDISRAMHYLWWITLVKMLIIKSWQRVCFRICSLQ